MVDYTSSRPESANPEVATHKVGGDHKVHLTGVRLEGFNLVGDHLMTEDHLVAVVDHLGDDGCVSASLGLACGRPAPSAWKTF